MFSIDNEQIPCTLINVTTEEEQKSISDGLVNDLQIEARKVLPVKKGVDLQRGQSQSSQCSLDLRDADTVIVYEQGLLTQTNNHCNQ